jgi:hypothetical protein
MVRKLIKTHNRCRETRLIQYHAGLQEMPNPIQNYTFPVILSCHASAAIFRFNCNPVRNGMPLAERPGLRDIQIVEIIQQCLPLAFRQLRNEGRGHTLHICARSFSIQKRCAPS